ncbi:hypothetical protein CesoFtcFv8_007577 [Champsocephalus esox]|uniref:Uncharacterized protein n=1 Tax=Champsocephalus esox TaxID=159716 RepID=A0AAN8CH34_9TELE|nr:hypothetical protein CesoFtcFv8_007577 [Champsocephalus esox]
MSPLRVIVTYICTRVYRKNPECLALNSSTTALHMPLDFKVETHISSWATLMLTKHQLVIAVFEWPIEAARQGAAVVPKESCQEGWRRQRSPSHLCPLG